MLAPARPVGGPHLVGWTRPSAPVASTDARPPAGRDGGAVPEAAPSPTPALRREGSLMDLLALDLGVAATAFLPLLLLELPDKTFIATLVLSTRYRPLTAWLGVGLAFGVQCVIAVT